jgi:biotin synthase
MKALIEKLARQRTLSETEFITLIEGRNEENARLLAQKADAIRQDVYGKTVYLRGLIEFTNYCKNDCYYCGIRRSNRNAQRYRLTQEEILDCCHQGYDLGYRTFVLQGGEDPWYTPERIEQLVRSIKTEYPDCAVTLSVGEHPKEVYKSWYDAGADRYLLRHETADPCHYAGLHPNIMSLENRMRCLWDLKGIGYQVGCGFMVGSPGQTAVQLAKDLLFIRELEPHMVGIGPFIPQKDTPLGRESAGTLELTLYLLSIIRLILPDVLLPATTALGTIHPQGRELGIMAGANVCMPNLSPTSVRKKYALYDNKICTGDEAAECVQCLRRRVESIGYEVAAGRGDHISRKEDR